MSEAIRLTPHIILVGSGEIGLTEEHDSHIYLVESEERWILFDAGAGIQTEALIRNIASVISQGKNLTHVFLTHCHADHSGGAAHLQARYWLHVIGGQITADRVRKGNDRELALDVARSEGIYPANYVFTPPQQVSAYPDQFQWQFGSTTITLIETPGHSADAVCYLVELPEGRALFCGDTLFADGTLPLLNTFDSDLSAYRQTIQRLSTLHFDFLLPGHGLFRLREAHEIAKQLESRLNRSIYLPPILTP